MRPVKRSILLFIMCSALGLAACGGGGDDDDGSSNTDGGNGTSPDGGGGNGTGVDPAGENHTYVLSDIIVPATPGEASMYSFDLDETGSPSDNALGKLLANAADLLDLNIQAVVREQIARGTVILLANLKATDLTNATRAGLYVYLGENASPAPCESEADTECGKHLQGGATFDISADSPDNALIVGDDVQGRFNGGPGTVSFEISLLEGQPPLTFDLIAARAEVSVGEEDLTNGKLGGAITTTDVDGKIIPALATILNGIVAEAACTGAPPDCCEAGTTPAQILTFADADHDCQVSAADLLANPILDTFLAADVDLLADVPGKDAISLGVGFSAVSGTFMPPAP